MPQNGVKEIPWFWTRKRELAAKLVADETLTGTEIGNQVDVGRRTLDRWKTSPEFQARVDGYIEAFKKSVRQKFLAVKEVRLQSLIEDFNATTLILRERGIDAAWMDETGHIRKDGAPGGSTGYLAREYQNRETADVIHEGKPAKVARPKAIYRFDSAIMRERRELRKQIAIELGEWDEVKIPDSTDRLDEVLAVLRHAEKNQAAEE